MASSMAHAESLASFRTVCLARPASQQPNLLEQPPECVVLVANQGEKAFHGAQVQVSQLTGGTDTNPAATIAEPESCRARVRERLLLNADSTRALRSDFLVVERNFRSLDHAAREPLPRRTARARRQATSPAS